MSESEHGKPDPTGIADALAAYEEAIGDLYDLYAVEFPRAAELWHGLSTEEYGHGSMIRDLGARVEDREVFLDGGRFQLREIEAAECSVREQIEVAQDSRMSLVEALERAADLEQSLIEQRSYEVFDSDGENVRKVLAYLRESSVRHRDRIRAYLEQVLRR